MNNICKNVIEIFYEYLNEKDNISLRQITKYFCNIITPKIFFNKLINVKKLKNKHHFRYFIHKYKLFISAHEILSHKQLLFLLNINTNHLTLNYLIQYYEYFLPFSLKHLKYSFNIPPKIKLLPKKLKLESDYNKFTTTHNNEAYVVLKNFATLTKVTVNIQTNVNIKGANAKIYKSIGNVYKSINKNEITYILVNNTELEFVSNLCYVEIFLSIPVIFNDLIGIFIDIDEPTEVFASVSFQID